RARDGLEANAAAAFVPLPSEIKRRDHEGRSERGQREMRAERKEQPAELTEEKRNAGGKIQRGLLIWNERPNVLPLGKFCVRRRARKCVASAANLRIP